MSLTLTPSQQSALNRLIDFAEDSGYTSADSFPSITLGGYAGTGKTTLMRQLNAALRDDTRIQFAAPTGKAAHVLRSKGLDDTCTLHKLLFLAIPLKNGGIVFKPKSTDELRETTDLLVVDEASMVSRFVYNAIRNAGIPTIFVGDHGQLEPVGDSPNLMDNPDIRLEEIMRQALDSPIISLAHELRNSPSPPSHRNLPGCVVCPSPGDTPEDFEADIIIVDTNRARVFLNKQYRDMLGHPADTPVVGDRIICLKNNNDLGIYNGMQATIDAIRFEGRDHYELTIRHADGLTDVMAAKRQFHHERGLAKCLIEDDIGFFDYAYAITCHKAQGSEWDNVLVLEDPSYSPPWTPSRWRYTACTRAAKSLVYSFLV